MRRLPVYILIQTSGAMRGEPIEAIKVGLETMAATLRQDPFALDSVWLSVITFNRSAQQILPLTELEKMQAIDIPDPVAAGALLGEALEFVCKKIDAEVLPTTSDRKGDWMPLLFIMCNGKAADVQLFGQMVSEIKRRRWGSIVVCLVGNKTSAEPLKQITDNIISMDIADSSTIRPFFKWVSSSVSVGSRSVGATSKITLPPPPQEINSVV
jgi:uncharacterized protein YegL